MSSDHRKHSFKGRGLRRVIRGGFKGGNIMLKRIYYKIFKRYRRLALKCCDYRTADRLIRESVGKPYSKQWRIAIPEEDHNQAIGSVFLERKERITR